jgi:hypothetical protein
MKLVHALFIGAVAVSLAGCAGSVSAPTTVVDLPPDARAQLRIGDVSADAASGVEMSEADLGLISQKVRADISAEAPGVLAEGPDAASAMKMKLHFTKFDRGNAFARFMLIGLGQIRIEADVDILNNSGVQIAQYKVSKDFALGGVAGGTTTVEDVEEGFAKSVAEVVKNKGKA